VQYWFTLLILVAPIAQSVLIHTGTHRNGHQVDTKFQVTRPPETSWSSVEESDALVAVRNRTDTEQPHAHSMHHPDLQLIIDAWGMLPDHTASLECFDGAVRRV
jgi:hypothetical protein